MTSLTAVEYQTALRRVNISLPLPLVQELLDILDQLKDAGKARRTEDGRYSVHDFIENVAKKGSPREVWKRFQEEHHSFCVTFCDSEKLPGKGGYQKTPVTSEINLLVIAYSLPGKLGDRLRKASADLVIETITAYKASLNDLFERSEEEELSVLRQQVAHLTSKVVELEQQLQTAIYPHSWSELHYRSNIVSKYQVRDAIKDYFEESVDYIQDGKELLLSPSCFYILLISFRSFKGTDITGLPKIIAIETIRYFQYLEVKRKNTRCGSRKNEEVDGQQTIPGIEV